MCEFLQSDVSSFFERLWQTVFYHPNMTLTRKWKCFCIQVLWLSSKTLNFPFIPLTARSCSNPASSFGTQFICAEAYSFFFPQTLWTTFEKQIQSFRTSCHHHSAKTRLHSAERFDWKDAAELQRAVKPLMGLILRAHSGYITTGFFSARLEIY